MQIWIEKKFDLLIAKGVITENMLLLEYQKTDNNRNNNRSHESEYKTFSIFNVTSCDHV